MAPILSGSVSISGVIDAAGLTRAVEGHRNKLRDAIKEQIGLSAARMNQRTVDLCPKDTYYMSEHVRTSFKNHGYAYTTGWNSNDFLGTIDEDGRARPFYPPYVELGTRKMAAQPSLSIAFREELPVFVHDVSEAIRQALTI